MPPPQPKISYENENLPKREGELRDQMEKKTTRYFPGKAPKWIDEDENEETPDLFGTKSGAEFPVVPEVDVQSDRRLARLAERASQRDEGNHRAVAELIEDDSSDDEATRRRDRARARKVAEVVVDSDDEQAPGPAVVDSRAEDSSEDENAIEDRRAKARERFKRRQAEEEAQAAARKQEEEAEKPDEEEEDEESEWETDSDEEDQYNAAARSKPKFVPRKERETILEQERLEEEEARAEENRQKQLEERKKESAQLLEDQLRQEELEAQKALSDEEMPDDDDDENEEEEYVAWKMREARRIKKERESRRAVAEEKAETLRRRNLTDEERDAEDRAAKADAEAKGQLQDKGKWKFMQKYYHKGSFFQDTNKFGVSEYDELYNRDYGGVTLEDHYDKSAMPKVLQVKKFGHIGRTKYTHLLDQDTTVGDSAWAQRSSLREDYNQKMGGMGSTLSRPAKKSKRHD